MLRRLLQLFSALEKNREVVARLSVVGSHLHGLAVVLRSLISETRNADFAPPQGAALRYQVTVVNFSLRTRPDEFSMDSPRPGPLVSSRAEVEAVFSSILLSSPNLLGRGPLLFLRHLLDPAPLTTIAGSLNC